jgi:hypothetical protein
MLSGSGRYAGAIYAVQGAFKGKTVVGFCSCGRIYPLLGWRFGGAASPTRAD